MKKFSFFALAAAGLLFSACSDKDDVNIAQEPIFGDGAFIGVSIQMPSANVNTRANEDFDDGVVSEYAVKDATLYIFKGETEAAATFVAQYQIGTSYVMDNGANVTSTMQEATQISAELAEEITKSNEATNYYGYVILNNNGVDVVCDEGTSFADFQVRQWNIIGTPVAEGADPTAENAFPNGLLMTNSPVSLNAGGAQAAPTEADNYSTLVLLDKTKIFATRAAAVADPAACIYVERAAVKITVAVNSSIETVGGTSDGPAIEFLEWQIVNYPETYYNTRQIDPAWGELTSDYPEVCAAQDPVVTPSTNWKAANRYRFVSGTAFAPVVDKAHENQPFRTYFAKDPTYNADATLLRPQAVDGKWIGMGIPGYTVENTFDVERQKWGNTTQVCFKAKINGGASFYTLNGGDTFVEDPEATVTGLVSGLPAVKKALQDAVDELVAADLAAWTATATPGTESPDYGYTASVAVSFTATPTESKDGVEMQADYTITGKNTDSTKSKADLTEATAKAITDALADALANYTVSFHKDGVAYYNARIQHFGEYETPWSLSIPFQTVIPGTTVEQIYGVGEDPDKSAARFLGRYGVVRDNWYKLSVDAVMHIGSAEPIDVSAEGNKNIPDDQIDNYLAVHVHIIPWVIRNQSINF